MEQMAVAAEAPEKTPTEEEVPNKKKEKACPVLASLVQVKDMLALGYKPDEIVRQISHTVRCLSVNLDEKAMLTFYTHAFLSFGVNVEPADILKVMRSVNVDTEKKIQEALDAK